MGAPSASGQLLPLLMAIGVGAVVGLVNEYRKISGARIFMGLRTSIFTSMLGYVFALIYEVDQSPVVLLVGFLVVTVIATSIYVERARATKILGATTYVSMLLVFAAGAFVGLGYYLLGAALSVIVATLSFYKTQLLSAISRIRREELLAILDLLVISLVILPALPDRFVGPYGIFNPFQFWLVVVVVSLIFFGQYVTLRVSRRGLTAFAIIGGLVSSTTVTLNLIDLANQERGRGLGRPLALNALVSNVPLALVQVLAAIYFTTYSAPIAALVAVPAVATTAAALGIAAWRRREMSPVGIEPPATPLPLLRILEFAVLLFVITAVSKVVAEVEPSYLPLVTFVGALANALGAVIAVGQLASHGLVTARAAFDLSALALAAGVAEKAPLSLLARDGDFRKTMAVGTAALVAVIAASSLPLALASGA